MNSTQELIHVVRPEGHIAVEVSGPSEGGPLVVLVPGMGDLRGTYRFLVPALVEAGYRVAATDLRGHGDSDVTFAHYGDAETASDIVAVIEELGGPAVVVGNSMGAAAAAIVAAGRPELVSGLVMLGPVVRDHPMPFGMKTLARVLLAPLWVAPAWKAALPSFYKGRTPADHAAYLTQIKRSLQRPGYGAAFSKLARTLTHAPAEAKLGAVRAPSLILMGALDPDSPAPADEVDWIAAQLGGPAEGTVVEECGHYPQSQRPDVVNPAVVAFLGQVARA
jgi:pimeloyl-ACP methyl ester carboxylesterase